jgi:hypothetical protein
VVFQIRTAGELPGNSFQLIEIARPNGNPFRKVSLKKSFPQTMQPEMKQ